MLPRQRAMLMEKYNVSVAVRGRKNWPAMMMTITYDPREPTNLMAAKSQAFAFIMENANNGITCLANGATGEDRFENQPMTYKKQGTSSIHWP